MPTTWSPASFSLLLQVAGRDPQHAVAVGHPALLGGKDGAVGVAVQSHAQVGAPFGKGLRHLLRVEGAAVPVDVLAVRGAVNEKAIELESFRQQGSHLGSRPVGAVDDQPDSAQVQAGRDELGQVVHITLPELSVGREGGRERRRHGRWTFCCRLVLKSFFNFSFQRIIQFGSLPGENLNAVVVIGVVRGRDHHAGVESVLARQQGHAGGGDDPGVGDLRMRLPQPGGQQRGNSRARLPRVSSHEHTGGIPFRKQLSEDSTQPVERLGVQRVFVGLAADAVGAEQFGNRFFRHEG